MASPRSRAVSVATTATRLDSASDEGVPASKQAFIFYNNGSATIYMGGSDVTTANGFPVPAGSHSPGMDLGSGETVYGIVASGTVEARVLERGV